MQQQLLNTTTSVRIVRSSHTTGWHQASCNHAHHFLQHHMQSRCHFHGQQYSLVLIVLMSRDTKSRICYWQHPRQPGPKREPVLAAATCDNARWAGVWSSSLAIWPNNEFRLLVMMFWTQERLVRSTTSVFLTVMPAYPEDHMLGTHVEDMWITSYHQMVCTYVLDSKASFPLLPHPWVRGAVDPLEFF